MKQDFIFDCETGDPDDVLTIILLATHPRSRLRAVTVTPGTRGQVGLIKHVLGRLGLRDVPVGSARPDHPKDCVSAFHYKWLGQDIPDAEPDALGYEIIHDILVPPPGLIVEDYGPRGEVEPVTIVTGAPLSNIWAAIEHGVHIPRIFIQGGFAGDNLMAPEDRLEKFAGKTTVATWNLGGDVKASQGVLASDLVGERHLVGKNICHGVAYTAELHERVKQVEHLYLLAEAMTVYRDRPNPHDKMLHDPLAACTAIDPSICTFVEAEVYREKGQWGSRAKEGTRTHVAVKHDQAKFEQVFLGG